MKPVAWPRSDTLSERLLWIDSATELFGDAHVRDLGGFVRPGDLLVVNDAATLPASLSGQTNDGKAVELRLVGQEGESWRCVVFGAGDWRTKTELRPLAPSLAPGAVVRFQDDLAATVMAAPSDRIVVVRFNLAGDAFWRALYRIGRPVQYAYVSAPLPLFHVQTGYASRPWAAEMPSAGRPLTGSLLLGLRAQGVGIARVTHAAGISSTGDEALDAALPWPERFDVPEETVIAVQVAKRSGGRVIAVGTSVVRALEGSAREHGGELRPGEGTTSLVMGPGFARRMVDGLFTGIHERTASHFSLLQSFATLPLLERAYDHAEKLGYEGHEFGDSCLLLNDVSAR